MAEWSKPLGLSHTVRDPGFMGSNPGNGRDSLPWFFSDLPPCNREKETMGLPIMLNCAWRVGEVKKKKKKKNRSYQRRLSDSENGKDVINNLV